MKTTFAVCTTVGRIRKENQDNFYLNGTTKQMQIADISLEGSSDEDGQVFAVCDGMGGEDAGEVAAFLAVEEMKRYSRENFYRQWKKYIHSANNAICAYQDEHDFQMGTTFAGLILHHNCMQAVNVGDSRIYRIRDGQMMQLSKDHTEFQLMVDAGIMKQEDFSKTTAHNHLTQSLGIDEKDMKLEPFHSRPEEIQDQDMFLLCSDGLYGVLSDEEIAAAAMEKESVLIRSRKLVDCAERKGSKDNITVLLISVSEEKQIVSEKITSEEASAETEFKQSAEVKSGKAMPREMMARKTMPRKVKYIVLVSWLVLFAAYSIYSWKNPKVPDVVGMDQKQAEQLIRDKGFQVNTAAGYTDLIEKGRIFIQSKTGNKRASRGSRVSLVVSLGAKTVTVMDVMGKEQEEAAAIMTMSGFRVNIRREYSDTVPKDCVISQIPAAGSELVVGSEVNLVISE
ncbi:MAG: PASTA domain-containing protein [Lachnospiraceae bacterium]|nr:PASTA domain-containing protein [Lachnospiraceae bacterium]